MTRREELIEQIKYPLNNISADIIVTEEDEDEKIKALEQESVLDKIRAEIEQAADKQFQLAMSASDLNERHAHIQMENAYRYSLCVIDKYKVESEDKE